MSQLGAKLFRTTFAGRIKRFAGIPGPTPSCPLGNLGLFLQKGKQSWEVCAEFEPQYGGLTLVWLPYQPALVLNDADLIGEVLDTNSQSYYKADPRNALLPVITDKCLFIANGAQWEKYRKHFPLHINGFDEWLNSQVSVVRQLVAQRAGELAAEPGPFDLYLKLRRLTFDAFSLIVWGKLLGENSHRLFLSLGKTGDRRIKSGPLAKIPPLNPRFWIDRRRWYEGFGRLVDETKQNPDPDAQHLLATVLRQGSPLDDETLRNQLVNILYGGGFSATSAIATTLYFLAQNPDVAKLACAEARELIGAGKTLDVAALEQSTWIDSALREALRILPPVPIYFRNVQRTQAVELGGHTIPASTLLFITNWALHRSAKHWTDPLRFDPTRWQNGGKEANPIGSGFFFPFGRGPRMCVGMPLAMFYMRLVLATLLAEVKVDIDPTQPYKQAFFFGVMNPAGLMARFTSAKGSSS